MPITLEAEGEAAVNFQFILYYCESAKEHLCYFKEAFVNLPVKVRAGVGNTTLRLVYQPEFS